MFFLSGAPSFGPHSKFAGCCAPSLYQREQTGAFLLLRCLNIYSNGMRLVRYLHTNVEDV